MTTRRLITLGLIVSALLIGVGANGDSIRIGLEMPTSSPYRRVVFEAVSRGTVTAATYRKELAGHDEGLHAMGLLTRGETDGLAALMHSTDARDLPDATAPRPHDRPLVWVVEVVTDGVLHRFRVRDPDTQTDRRYARLISGVQRIVRATTGPLPFRNVFFRPERRGWVYIRASPAARVWIDGFDTQLDTPMHAYELDAGDHIIRLVGLDGGPERAYKIRVEPQGTTHLNVDLR